MKPGVRITALILAAFGVIIAAWLLSREPEIREDSLVTREGIVTDRAMSDGLPYLSVVFEDGTDVCCWQLHKGGNVPDEISVGDPVRITYGVETAHGRYALVHVEAVQE